MKLPKFIENKKAVVNIRNEDQNCFAWAVTSAIYPPIGPVQEVSSYPHFSTVLNVTGMDFPIKLKDISKFETLNNISVSVYGLEKEFKNNKIKYEIVGPLRYAPKKLRYHVNLLLITEDCGENHHCRKECIKSHYCWIKNFSRLVSSQVSLHEHRKYFCDGCLMYFSSEKSLLQHQSNDCNHVYTTTPSNNFRIDKFGKSVPENILKFENFEKQLKVPFVVYADFESILKPFDTCEPNPAKSFTNKTFSHEPFSFAYLIKCSFDDSLSKFVLYRGQNAGKEFIRRLESDLKQIYNEHLKEIVPMMPLSTEEEQDFLNATVCGICEKPFMEGEVKARDHCHLTGRKRYGAAHSVCNLNYKLPNFVPIILHSMSSYDSHLFIKELCSNKDKIEVIAQSKEKYISFTKNVYLHNYIGKDGKVKKKYLKMRFIDSFKFLSTSLENLANNLSDNQFQETVKHFPDGEQFNLIRQKGVFPYSFLTTLDKLNSKILPTKEEFYDNLSEEHISEADYHRAQKTWNVFNCQNLGEYSDTYLKSDVLILCDVFENFRNISLEKYHLDPAQYFTAPGLAWDAMLRLTKVELELMTDISMIHFFKRGIRGGISQCSERKHVANNIFVPNYNPQESSSFIAYLDATNLYGHSMSQYLPTGGFEWLSEQEIINFDVTNIPEEGRYGYTLEVDMEYPSELHDLHRDLPFLAESMVPPHSKSKIPKLIPNLNNKSKYIIHFRNLKQAIRNGLKLKKIHRIIKFNQSCWLKAYIDLNTEMRNKATSKFEKDLYKLMNNAVYGKTMENVDNRRDIKLITHWERRGRSLGANTLIARPNFKTCTTFSEDFVAIHMGRTRAHYNKPLYLGFSILELSKTVLYNFYYDVIKRNYKDNASLLYTDTDSLIIKIYTENFYEFIKSNPKIFDTSNYKEGNKFGIPVSASVLGNMKDEFPSDPIIEFYGTGAKAYYVKSVNTEVKKAKGIKKSVIKNNLTAEDYKKIVEQGGIIFRKMSSFRSELHNIYTEIKNKVALSYFDDKRFIIPNTTHSLPWGHNDIQFYLTDAEKNFEWFVTALSQTAGCDNDSSEVRLKNLLNALEELIK